MRAEQVKALAKAIATNFMAAGFSATDLLTGQITLTDLPWQCPPIESNDLLGGFPFSDYVDYTVKVDTGAVIRFHRWGLAMLFSSPTSVCAPGGWKGLSAAMPGSTDGERALRFATPEEFPRHNQYSGSIFTLEVVKLLSGSSDLVKALQSDANNYYVEFDDESLEPLGIRDGMIIGDNTWLTDSSGFVDVQLSSPRGFIDNSCQYGLLDKLRSILHENADAFPEYQGMDYALQALRRVSGGFCKPMLMAVQNMLPDGFEAKRKIKVIDEANEMLEMWTVNDQVKIGTLYEILVPTVWSLTQFYSKVCNLSRPAPTIMHDKTMIKIRENLKKERDAQMTKISPRDRPTLERK